MGEDREGEEDEGGGLGRRGGWGTRSDAVTSALARFVGDGLGEREVLEEVRRSGCYGGYVLDEQS